MLSVKCIKEHLGTKIQLFGHIIVFSCWKTCSPCRENLRPMLVKLQTSSADGHSSTMYVHPSTVDVRTSVGGCSLSQKPEENLSVDGKKYNRDMAV